MFQPARSSPPTSPMARMTLMILITIDEGPCGLFPKMPHVCNQLIDLRLGEFLLKGRHLVPAVVDRIEKPFVSYIILPLPICHVARMRKLAFESLTATILTVTRSALRIESRLGIAGNYNTRVRSRGVRKNEHHCDRYNQTEPK